MLTRWSAVRIRASCSAPQSYAIHRALVHQSVWLHSETRRCASATTRTANASTNKLAGLIAKQYASEQDRKGRETHLEARNVSLEESNRSHPVVHGPASKRQAGHHDLDSFKVFAAENGLSTSSTVYKGTLYEYVVAQALSILGMDLERVGKANDRGIDLLGRWTLPDTSTVSVLIQCKMTRPLPQVVRELEGTCSSAPMSWSGQKRLALLASQHEATPGVLQALQRSPIPMTFLQVTAHGLIKQCIWNSTAADTALGGLGVTTRHPAILSSEGQHHQCKQDNEASIVLTWLGKPWKRG